MHVFPFRLYSSRFNMTNTRLSDKGEHETEEFHEQPEVKIYSYLKDHKQTF